jgi:hypothetical protein
MTRSILRVVDRGEPWKPWANDAESFERAVLAELEQMLGGHTPELMRRACHEGAPRGSSRGIASEY